MKHFGDITKLRGSGLPLVDIITGGSPCQDLSVAGKRKGLDGERSGLFLEQIRIIKELRNESRRTNQLIRPRYMVWENVAGAFSSNSGNDFRLVLEHTARIADSSAVIPELPKKQKWTKAGAIMGDGWSVAWRLHDSQFWGVPQRRRRIALVADFGGQTAPKVLFERKSLSGCSPKGKTEGQENTRNCSEDLGKSGAECYSLDRASFNQGINAKYDIAIEEGLSQPVIARGPNAVVYKGIARRYTPLECERLQGFPDGWTDIGDWIDSKGKKHKAADSPRYKALGNSIALPFWQWLAERMVAQLRSEGVKDPTMASLFDGIGGFPLVFSKAGCVPVWASEIEEFPIAVTKMRFG